MHAAASLLAAASPAPTAAAAVLLSASRILRQHFHGPAAVPVIGSYASRSFASSGAPSTGAGEGSAPPSSSSAAASAPGPRELSQALYFKGEVLKEFIGPLSVSTVPGAAGAGEVEERGGGRWECRGSHQGLRRGGVAASRASLPSQMGVRGWWCIRLLYLGYALLSV